MGTSDTKAMQEHEREGAASGAGIESGAAELCPAPKGAARPPGPAPAPSSLPTILSRNLRVAVEVAIDVVQEGTIWRRTVSLRDGKETARALDFKAQRPDALRMKPGDTVLVERLADDVVRVLAQGGAAARELQPL